MKTTFTFKANVIAFLFLLLFQNFLQAQKRLISDTALSKVYFLKVDTRVFQCNISGDSVRSKVIVAPEGALFEVIGLNKDSDVIIKFKRWATPKYRYSNSYQISQLDKINTFNFKVPTTDTTIKLLTADSIERLINADVKKLLTPDSIKKLITANNKKKQRKEYSIQQKIDLVKQIKKFSEEKDIYFIIKKAIFSASVSRYIHVSKWDITAGALAIPFKIRLKQFDFSKDVAFTGTAAFGYRFTKNFTSYGVAALGISSIGIDSLNTNGKIKKSTNLSAFTISPGVVLAWQRLQITLNCGWDFLSKADSDNGWIYNKKLWLGIGIGIQLFNPNSDTQKPAGKNQD